MAVSIAFTMVFLAAAGVVVSWVVGAVYYGRSMAAVGRDDGALQGLAILAWPFALGRVKGATTADATVINKALVALMACMMALVAATAVATNLARIAK